MTENPPLTRALFPQQPLSNFPFVPVVSVVVVAAAAGISAVDAIMLFLLIVVRDVLCMFCKNFNCNLIYSLNLCYIFES